MKTTSRAKRYVQAVQAQIAKALCKEQAINCGYAALASAIEGRAWERTYYLNLMRRFGFCANELDSLTARHRIDEKPLAITKKVDKPPRPH